MASRKSRGNLKNTRRKRKDEELFFPSDFAANGEKGIWRLAQNWAFSFSFFLFSTSFPFFVFDSPLDLFHTMMLAILFASLVAVINPLS